MSARGVQFLPAAAQGPEETSSFSQAPFPPLQKAETMSPQRHCQIQGHNMLWEALLCSGKALPFPKGDCKSKNKKKTDYMSPARLIDLWIITFLTPTAMQILGCAKNKLGCLQLRLLSRKKKKKAFFARHKKQAALPKLENTEIKIPSWTSHLENSRLYQDEDMTFFF